MEKPGRGPISRVRQSELTTFVGTVDPDTMARVCRALAIACAREGGGASAAR